MAERQQQPEACVYTGRKAESFGGSLVSDQGHIYLNNKECVNDLGQTLAV